MAVRVPLAEAEIARARLLPLAPGGFEEADADDAVELRVYTDPAGEARVVAIAAARLGFGPVVAVDADPVAVAAARSNGASNGVRVEVRVADVLRDTLPAADLLVANIDLPVVEALLARRLADRAITSGYLDHEAPRVQGWEPLARLELDGWAADSLALS